MDYGKKKKLGDLNNSLMSNNKLMVTIKYLKSNHCMSITTLN
jgi:hypothetical protein